MGFYTLPAIYQLERRVSIGMQVTCITFSPVRLYWHWVGQPLSKASCQTPDQLLQIMLVWTPNLSESLSGHFNIGNNVGLKIEKMYFTYGI